MALYKNLTDEQRLALTAEDSKILDDALGLDARFETQFERHSFDYIHPKEDIDYLPAVLENDRRLVKDRTVGISYTYWPAKNGDENAKTLIYLGGIYQGARRNDFFAEQASENANVVCLDYPGKGHSGNLYLPQDYSLRTYSKIVAALVDHLNPQTPFSIIGQSYGAKIIYEMVEQGFTHPQWESAVLGDMAPEAPAKIKAERAWHPRGASKYATINESLKALQKFSRPHGALPQDYFVHAMNHEYAYDSRPGASGYGRAQDHNAMIGYGEECTGPYNKWTAYKDIPVPVLLTVGEQSDTVDTELLQRMLIERPDASVLLFHDAAHYPELYLPDHIQHVMDWIQKQNPGHEHMPLRIEVPGIGQDDRTAIPLREILPPAAPIAVVTPPETPPRTIQRRKTPQP